MDGDNLNTTHDSNNPSKRKICTDNSLNVHKTTNNSIEPTNLISSESSHNTKSEDQCNIFHLIEQDDCIILDPTPSQLSGESSLKRSSRLRTTNTVNYNEDDMDILFETRDDIPVNSNKISKPQKNRKTKPKINPDDLNNIIVSNIDSTGMTDIRETLVEQIKKRKVHLIEEDENMNDKKKTKVTKPVKETKPKKKPKYGKITKGRDTEFIGLGSGPRLIGGLWDSIPPIPKKTVIEKPPDSSVQFCAQLSDNIESLSARETPLKLNEIHTNNNINNNDVSTDIIEIDNSPQKPLSNTQEQSSPFHIQTTTEISTENSPIKKNTIPTVIFKLPPLIVYTDNTLPIEDRVRYTCTSTHVIDGEETEIYEFLTRGMFHSIWNELPDEDRLGSIVEDDLILLEYLPVVKTEPVDNPTLLNTQNFASTTSTSTSTSSTMTSNNNHYTSNSLPSIITPTVSTVSINILTNDCNVPNNPPNYNFLHTVEKSTNNHNLKDTYSTTQKIPENHHDENSTEIEQCKVTLPPLIVYTDKTLPVNEQVRYTCTSTHFIDGVETEIYEVLSKNVFLSIWKTLPEEDQVGSIVEDDLILLEYTPYIKTENDQNPVKTCDKDANMKYLHISDLKPSNNNKNGNKPKMDIPIHGSISPQLTPFTSQIKNNSTYPSISYDNLESIPSLSPSHTLSKSHSNLPSHTLTKSHSNLPTGVLSNTPSFTHSSTNTTQNTQSTFSTNNHIFQTHPHSHLHSHSQSLTHSAFPSQSQSHSHTHSHSHSQSQSRRLHYSMFDDIEIDFVTSETTTSLPHYRSQCTNLPIIKDSPIEEKYNACEQCFCCLCDRHWSVCPIWKEHCNINHLNMDTPVMRKCIKTAFDQLEKKHNSCAIWKSKSETQKLHEAILYQRKKNIKVEDSFKQPQLTKYMKRNV